MSNTAVYVGAAVTSALKVYPNPLTGSVTIEGLAKNAEIEVRNLTGQLDYRGKSAGARQVLNLAQLPVGANLLSTRSGAGTPQVRRIIKP